MYLYLSQTAFVVKMPTCVSVLTQEDDRVVCLDEAGNVIATFPQGAVYMYSDSLVEDPLEEDERSRAH